MIPKFKGVVRKGKIVVENTAAFKAYVESLDGKEVSVVVKRWRNSKQKTLPQLKYYWGVIIPLACEHFGYFPDDMHAAFGQKFLLQRDAPVPYVRTTALHEWDTVEWENYMEKLKTWLSGEGVYIPDPDDVDYSKLGGFNG